jgi:CubicO group peptidase (beta-lactamase class C family)
MRTVPLPRATPESQGVPSSAIRAFLDAIQAKGLELHSVMLLRHGHVVAEGWWEPYAADIPHVLYSLSKSLTATAAGLAMADGHFSLDDAVIDFFPDDLPDEVSDNLRAMTVRHLLTMTAGHGGEGWSLAAMSDLFSAPDDNWARAYLARPVEFEPGSHFAYCSGSTYMVSAIIQKTTGQTLLEYLTPRLFEPLGIREATWWSCPRGVNMGGIGLNLTTESIAKFGQLYLQDGVWDGVRLLPVGWVAEATARQVPNGDPADDDWHQGYGYQFWRCRHACYRADGANGQFCIVMPEQDAVIAITGGLSDMGAVTNLVWEHLLPAMGPDALPDNPAAREGLNAVLSELALSVPQGEASSPIAVGVSGRTYKFPPNDAGLESLSWQFGDDAAILTSRNVEGEYLLRCGYGRWDADNIMMMRGRKLRVTARGAWTSDDIFTAKFCVIETEMNVTLTCRFEDDGVVVDQSANVGWGPKLVQLAGRMNGMGT